MRTGPGLGCGLLRAAGRTRVLRGARSPGRRASALGRAPGLPGGPGWPLPSAARPAARHCPTRCGLLTPSAASCRPASPSTFLSLSCFPPALVRHSVSFVRIRSPDRLLGHESCSLKALLPGSSTRVWTELQAPFAGQATHSSTPWSRGLLRGAEAVERVKVGIVTPGSGLICPGP